MIIDTLNFTARVLDSIDMDVVTLIFLTGTLITFYVTIFALNIDITLAYSSVSSVVHNTINIM